LAGLAGREGRAGQASFATEPLTEVLEDHLEEAGRQQDRLADLLQADPAEQPEGWPLRGEILAHVDRLRRELQPRSLPEADRVRRPLLTRPHAPRAALRARADRTALRARANRTALRGRARRAASRVRVRAGRR
jgi:hypothetical protein